MTMLTSSLVSNSIVDTFVVVYKFAFVDFSLFHRKVTVICYIAITLIIWSLSVFLGSESVFSIFVSIY